MSIGPVSTGPEAVDVMLENKLMNLSLISLLNRNLLSLLQVQIFNNFIETNILSKCKAIKSWVVLGKTVHIACSKATW